MKKTILFSISIALGLSVFGQSIQKKATEMQVPVTEPVNQKGQSEVRGIQPVFQAGNKISAPQYANDVIIENSALDQRNVKVSAAFNGWVYSAYTTSNTVNGNGGITIRRSKDNGLTWTTINSLSFANTKFPVVDIVVAGADTNNLTLYVTGVNNNTTTGTYILWFDKYNATTGALLGQFGTNINYGTRKVYDVAIASDYKFPAFGTSPYGLAVLYSVYGSMDSVIYLASTNGGTSLNVRQPLYSTGAYCRKVSLSYSHSFNYSNGRYFAAWERCATSTARNANIYMAHNVTTMNGAWTAPKNLDSLDSGMLGRCRYPSIAAQQSSIDNDSSNVTAAVLVERDYGGTATDYDILGFYNKQAVGGNYWKRFDVNNTGEKDNSPHMVYDPTNNNFLAVYHDSTNHKLPYCVNGMNMAAPNTWGFITTQYNDLTTNIINPWPRVDINPVAVKTVHVWNSEGAGKGVALFDAENLATVVKEATEILVSGEVYPNPTRDNINLSFELKSTQNVSLELYDALGNVVIRDDFSGLGAGKNYRTVNVSSLQDGVYILKLSSDKILFSKKIVKTGN